MNLAEYPPRFFDLVFPAHVSHLALRLYKCNNRLLNTKLLTLTIVSLEHLEGAFEHLGGRRPIIPRFVSELPNLSHFRVQVYDKLVGELFNWPFILRAIPSSIKSLELMSSDSYGLLTNDGSLPPTKVPETEIPSNLPSLIDLSAVFPHLTTLKLRILARSLFRFLPSTLTHLSIGGAVNLPFMSSLPRSLEMFDCKISVYDAHAHDDQQLDDFLSDLTLGPPNMRLPNLCQISISILYTTDKDNPYNWASRLPEGLENIAAHPGLQPALLAAAPRSLTRIEMIYLPEWEAYLQLFNDNKSSDANKYWSIWPPSLVQLGICVNDLEPSTLGAIPKSLTLLRLVLGDADHIRLAAPSLPPRLTSLDIACEGDGTGIFIDGVPPPSLHHFGVVGKIRSVVRLENNLPSLVTSTQLITLKTVSGSLLSLPVALIKIDIRQWESEWFSLLPRTVTSIIIETLEVAGSSINSSNLFEGSPKILKTLSIEKMKIAQNALLSEPQTPDWPVIQSLKLPQTLKVSSTILKSLPRVMQELELELEVRDENDLEFLPSALKCSIGDSTLHWSSAGKFWPVQAIRRLPYDVFAKHRETFCQRYADLAHNY